MREENLDRRPADRSRLERLRIAAADFMYRLGWILTKRVPEPVARWTFARLADWAWFRHGHRVLRLEQNLRRVIGPGPSQRELRRLSRAGMRSYMRYWMEAFRLPVTSPRRIRSGMSIEGYEKVPSTLDCGRGVIIALPHMGNWDHAGAWLVLHGHRFTTVQERLEPDSLFRKFTAYREGLGMEILALTSGDGSVFGTLAQRLRAGGVVCLVADRDLTRNGVEVPFFGAQARLPAGPAALAMQTGAALMPVTLWYEKGGWGARVHDEISVPDDGGKREKIAAMTLALAAVFEEAVALHPEDWHMMSRLWVEDR